MKRNLVDCTYNSDKTNLSRSNDLRKVAYCSCSRETTSDCDKISIKGWLCTRFWDETNSTAQHVPMRIGYDGIGSATDESILIQKYPRTAQQTIPPQTIRTSGSKKSVVIGEISFRANLRSQSVFSHFQTGRE